MNISELRMLQSLPLEVKVAKSKRRIIEWVEHYGHDSVYCSFSGGVGSTVLYFLLQEVVSEQGWDPIPCLFVNTRNEYPEVIRHVYSLKGQHNAKYRKIMGDRTYNCPQNLYDCIEVRIPNLTIREVIMKHGYLIVSKLTSREIHDLRIFSERNDEYAKERLKKLRNYKLRYSVPKKYQYLVNAPFKISSKCCHELKHSVFASYAKETGRKYPITGEQASESKLREVSYLKFGCNGYSRSEPKSTPLGFWMQHDLLVFLLRRNLPYPECYGEITLKNGKYVTTGEKRTGCMCCMAGIMNEGEGEKNRFQRMELKYPVHYKMMFTPLDQGGLGANEVLDYLHVPYRNKEILDMDEFMELFNFM